MLDASFETVRRNELISMGLIAVALKSTGE